MFSQSPYSPLTPRRLYSNYQTLPQWPPSQTRHSTYQSTPFAQSVIQHTTPSSSYPTPPPPGISSSSSSLAGALGPAPYKPPRQVHHPHESPAFFNTFLSQTPAPPPPVVKQPPPPPPPQPQSQPIPLADIPIVDLGSPDPLAAAHPSPAYTLTPRKRKVDQYLESPSVKRVQVASVNRASIPSAAQTPPRPAPKQTFRKQNTDGLVQTPSKQQRKSHTPVPPASNRSTPSSSSARPSSAPYVAVPPRPKAYHTPISQKKERPEVVITTTTLSANGKAKMKTGDEYDDLGGFGSEGETTLSQYKPPNGTASVKGSVRKPTGERDERGGCYYHRAYIDQNSRLLSPAGEACYPS